MIYNNLLLYEFKPDMPIATLCMVADKNSGEYDDSHIGDCVRLIISDVYAAGLSGDALKAYLTDFLVNCENPYSLSCERNEEVNESLRKLALYDIGIIREVYSIISALPLCSVEIKNDKRGRYSHTIVNSINELSKKLFTASNDTDFLALLTEFYRTYGVGKLGLHKAFRLDELGNISAIDAIPHVSFDTLVGCDDQKAALINNTEAFINGKPANNVLLYGEAGTGKSTSIKALTNAYYSQGLRVIEIYKHEFKYLNKIISKVKNRAYKFILYMDDLSFEDFETEYKYLKAVIEGGLEDKPKNVLIYASSNRRHLIKESFKDNPSYSDDLHGSETKQEKLSLYHRFGETIYFGSPDRKEFERIVLELAHRADVGIPDDQLLAEANSWEITHGGRSGRTARQFVDHLLGAE